MRETNSRSRVSRRKHKPPFYKKWWFWLIIVILVIGGIGNIVDPTDDSEQSSTKESQVKKVKKNKQSPKKKTANKKNVKKEKSTKIEPSKQIKKSTVQHRKYPTKTSWDFNTIGLGMTKEQVKSILGEPSETTFTGKFKYGNDTLTFVDNKLYDGTPENIKQAAINRDKPEKLKAFAKSFGLKDAETVQKMVGSAYASKYIDGQGMTYAWSTEYGTLMRVDNPDNRITTVYLYNKDTQSLGEILYQGQTILQKPKNYYYYN